MIQPLTRTGPYQIDWRDGPGDGLILAFSSVGHDPERCPSPEFVGTTRGLGRAVFVRDNSRSWAQDPAFGPMLHQVMAAMTAQAPVRRIMALGLSMGAFSALAATRVLAVDMVLAFGPQWTLDNEPRWADWTRRLPRRCQATVPQTGWTCILHGLRDDRTQALPFPARRGLDHVLFPGFGHSDLMAHLKAQGGLAGMVQAAMADDRRRFLRLTGAAGGQLRHRGGRDLLHPAGAADILPTSIEGNAGCQTSPRTRNAP